MFQTFMTSKKEMANPNRVLKSARGQKTICHFRDKDERSANGVIRNSPFTQSIRLWPNDSIFHSIFSSTFDLKVEQCLSVV